MPNRFFVVPIQASQEAADELNRFLASHRVLSVDRRWVDQGHSSFWCFCIDYLDGPGSTQVSRPAPGRNKVDYKDVLSPNEFSVFARLRDVRKQLGASEAVPLYTIMTNEQLSQMVKLRCATPKDLERVVGVGDARIEKYGAAFLNVLRTADTSTGVGNEASGKPV